MVSLTALRSQFKQILSLQESPHRIALAFAIGVFIAFAPHYGFHTLSALFCAWAFRLNILALLLGSFINNPWTVLPILALTFWTGFSLFGMTEAFALNWDELTLETLYNMILPSLLPFIVGGCVLGVIGAIVAYPVFCLLVSRYKKS